MDNIKKVLLPETNRKSKDKGKRKVASTKEWELNAYCINIHNQNELLQQIINDQSSSDNSLKKLLEKGIQTKIQGYRSQDVKKKLHNEELFVDFNYVIELINESLLECYYCKKECILLYENVKDPNQWTLDRLDNKHGHNKKNVVIACLSCNLKRKTMHHGRFQFTKQLQITKNETPETDLK